MFHSNASSCERGAIRLVPSRSFLGRRSWAAIGLNLRHHALRMGDSREMFAVHFGRSRSTGRSFPSRREGRLLGAFSMGVDLED